MADSRYITITRQSPSEDEVIQRPKIFRDIRTGISKNTLGIEPSGRIIIEGEYPENKLYFDRYDISTDGEKAFLTTVRDTNIQFILKVLYNDTQKFFTSTEFHRKLVSTYSQNLPYQVLTSLRQIVEIDLNPIVDKVKSFANTERIQGVEMELNNFLNLSYNEETEEQDVEVDYTKLVEYIDWMVTKPTQNYDDRLLPINNLLSYNRIDIDNESLLEDSTQEDDS